MQNGINNIQQSVNNSVNALQQQMNQMQEALLQMNSWEYTFEQNNGRKPYEIEKDQWMQQKYPGLYNLYIQSKYYYNSGTQVNEERGEDTYSQSYIIIKRLRLL